MRIVALVTVVLSLLVGAANAGSIPFTTIGQALVADKMMPTGTEVKVKVLQISDQFNARLAVVCFPESPFKSGEPGTASLALKEWPAKDLQVDDVLRYTTTRRGFIGFTVGPDYRKLYLENVAGGYRLTLDYNEHRWLVEVSFPDYD